MTNLTRTLKSNYDKTKETNLLGTKIFRDTKIGRNERLCLAKRGRRGAREVSHSSEN